jgi:hypothetical protein
MDLLGFVNDIGQDDKIDSLEQLVKDLMYRVESLEKRLDEQDYCRKNNLV